MNAENSPSVFIIDDDAGVRASIQGLPKSVGLRSEAFATPHEFLQSYLCVLKNNHREKRLMLWRFRADG